MFICLKKIVDIIGEIKFPNYNNLKNESNFWKNFVFVRDFLNALSLVLKIAIIYYLKLTGYILALFLLLILNNVFYFLVEERFIYYFIPKEKLNLKVLDWLDKYGGLFDNLLTFLLAFYIIIHIFS